MGRGGAGTATPVTSAPGVSINVPNVINITDSRYGAVGDGTTDCSAAIALAVSDMTTGSTLMFPRGSYRFTSTSPTGGAAIYLNKLSNVTLWFLPGAELLMDNLSAGSGTTHGVKVVGSCSNVTLHGVRVRWATAPSVRSTGDGFHILGYPGDAVNVGWTGSTGSIVGLKMIDCETVNAPQCGAILMGCDRPRVTNFLAKDTLADGLHFNACRNPRVTGYTADNTGDDGLALVTYYAANSDSPASDVYAGQNGPFAMQTMSEWANGGAQASGVTVKDGSANGVRIAGVYNGSVTGVSVSGKSVGIIIDSGEAGGSYDWTYLASRGCTISGAAVEDCSTGVLCRVYNSDSDDDEKYWRYDCTVSDMTIRNCSNRCFRTEGSGSGQKTVIAGLNISNIRGYGSSISFSSIRESVISDISCRSGNVEFFGQDVTLSGAMSGLARHDVVIDGVMCDGGRILFQDFRGVSAGSIRSLNAPTDGVIFTRVHTATFSDIHVTLPNRNNTGTVRGVLFDKGQHIYVANIFIDHDANTTTSWRTLEFGGGDATDISTNIVIDSVVYRNTINSASADVSIQGGGFAPTNYIYRMRHYNGGEASPIWRNETWGSTTWSDNFAYTGTPEGQITAKIGSTYQRYNGGASTSFYVKESGTGNTGWVAK